MQRFLAAVLVLGLVGCGGGGGGGGDPAGPGSGKRKRAPLLLVAGMNAIPPGERGPWADTVDLARLGLEPGGVDAFFDLSTPAAEPFQFDVVSRRAGNAGTVTVSLAHGADDGNTPPGGPESVASVGIVPSAPGAVNRFPWMEAAGDGFSRISLRGAVDREQVLVVRTDDGSGETTALVRVGIGGESAINLAARGGGDYPGVKDAATLYSSNSWLFGLPVAAVSGDRTTVVAYEGDRADPNRWVRYEMRLQRDHLTGDVTGGASEEASPDSGNWRDHEMAGLFNTLALVHSGTDRVTLRLSLDRGASFGQTLVLDRTPAGGSPRLVQVAMAADYTTAVAFWKPGRSGATDLLLVLARPDAFDGGGSPTRFVADPPRLVRSVPGDVAPLVTGLAWSAGGDLVVGYGFSSFTSGPDFTWRSLTQNRCAVFPWNGAMRDTLVEEEEIVGKDPSVAVLGSGDSMRVFFAYEASDGVRMRVSGDAGRTFGAPIRADDPTSAMPTVLARMQDGTPRVDLLWLAQGTEGQELRLRHWDDFDGGPAGDFSLTRATLVPSASTPRGRQAPGARMGIMAPETGHRVTEVAWFGYSAVLDGDDVVVVYDEVTYDAFVFFGGFEDVRRLEFLGGVPQAGGSDFMPAAPPPLAPGLTEPVPAPDPGHMHQLKTLRLD